MLKIRRRAGPESLIRASVEAEVAAHRVQPKLHRIFTEESERLGLGSTDLATDADTKAAQQAWFEHARGSVEDPELSKWIRKTTIHALVHQAACERPQDLDRELFVDEITRLITRYLKSPPLAQSHRKKSHS